MDRRKFFGTLAGGLVAAPFVARTEGQEAARPLQPPSRAGNAATGMLRPTGDAIRAPLRSVVFKRGVPQRISLASQLPGADRYSGGYFDQTTGYKSYFDNLYGVWFDAITLELVYDGRDPDPFKTAANPNPQYFVGVENGPYNSHWQWPATPLPIPLPKAGISQALANGNKHTAPVYCPRDKHVHIFGGDFSTSGLVGGGQNGRPVMWDWDPIANTWRLDYRPPHGMAGDVIPLSPDLMGMCWLPDQEVFFIAWGVSRPGFPNAAAWKADGGVANALPADNAESDPTKLPCFIFDPKLARPRFLLAGVGIDWAQNDVRQIEYDPVSKRVYGLRVYNDRVRVHYLDVSTLGSATPSLAWRHVDVPTVAGHSYAIPGQWKINVDEAGRRLFWFDARRPALMAITLSGHPEGEFKMQVVTELPAPAGSIVDAAMGLTASIPAAWIPEHRSIVVMWEPLWHQVGPNTASLTINVDTGVVSQGPRFPNMDGGRKQPWFPGEMVWYPPTQELLVYGFMYSGEEARNDIALSGMPQTNWRYKWIDGPDTSHPVSAWTFFRIDSVAVK